MNLSPEERAQIIKEHDLRPDITSENLQLVLDIDKRIAEQTRDGTLQPLLLGVDDTVWKTASTQDGGMMVTSKVVNIPTQYVWLLAEEENSVNQVVDLINGGQFDPSSVIPLQQRTTDIPHHPVVVKLVEDLKTAFEEKSSDKVRELKQYANKLLARKVEVPPEILAKLVQPVEPKPRLPRRQPTPKHRIMCRHFNAPRGCYNGSHCEYFHPTRACRDYQTTGRCPRGVRCTFSHKS